MSEIELARLRAYIVKRIAEGWDINRLSKLPEEIETVNDFLILLRENCCDLPSALYICVKLLDQLEKTDITHGSFQNYEHRLVAELCCLYGVAHETFHAWDT